MTSDPSGKKQPQKDSGAAPNKLVGFIQFLKEVRLEFFRISWPDRKQVIRETYSVIVLVAIITGVVLAFDFAVDKVIFTPLDHFAKSIGGGIGR